MKRIGFSSVTLAFLLAGCAASSENLKPQTDVFTDGSGFIQYDIRLRPQDDGTIELPNNSGCKKGAGQKKGCVAFEPGTYGVLNISVSNSGHDNKSCADGGVQWVITLLQIADTGNLDTGKSPAMGQPVNTATQASLYPFEDPSTGTIFKELPSEGRTSVRILNRNDNATGTTENFWYFVEATRCRDHSIIAKTDPRIENKGR